MKRKKVSIAEAILWGEQLNCYAAAIVRKGSFNRRGDSLGGATPFDEYPGTVTYCFNRRGDSLGGATRH